MGPPNYFGGIIYLGPPTPMGIIYFGSTNSSCGIIGCTNSFGDYYWSANYFGDYFGPTKSFGNYFGYTQLLRGLFWVQSSFGILDFLGPAVACEIFNPNFPTTDVYIFTHCPTQFSRCRYSVLYTGYIANGSTPNQLGIFKDFTL